MSNCIREDGERAQPPGRIGRIASVWYRHYRVYTRNFISNAFPPFLEPVFFLLAIGIGLGTFITRMENMSYFQFLASGMMIPPAMYTASFECTFGTFIRLEFEKVYDGMLASPLTYTDMILGEILFCAVKSFFFSACVLIVITVSSGGTFPLYPAALLAPIGGLLTGLMFAPLSLIVTSLVKNINHFNFYFTGLLTPMFMVSGIVFPLSSLPAPLLVVAEAMPLAHAVRIVRALCTANVQAGLAWDFLYIVLFCIIATLAAMKLLKKRFID